MDCVLLPGMEFPGAPKLLKRMAVLFYCGTDRFEGGMFRIYFLGRTDKEFLLHKKTGVWSRKIKIEVVVSVHFWDVLS